MNRIKKTLMAGAFVCAAANVHAETSTGFISYGVQVGPSMGIMSANDDAQFGGKKTSMSYFGNVMVSGGVFGDFLLANYVGVHVGIGYMRCGGELKAEGEADPKPSAALLSHRGVLSLGLRAFPMGYNDEEDNWYAGASYFPSYSFGYTLKQGDQETHPTDEQKKELVNYDLGTVQLSTGYEFAMGVFVGVDYSFGFMNNLKVENNANQTLLTNLSHATSLKNQAAKLEVGFNFAKLLKD